MKIEKFRFWVFYGVCQLIISANESSSNNKEDRMQGEWHAIQEGQMDRWITMHWSHCPKCICILQIFYGYKWNEMVQLSTEDIWRMQKKLWTTSASRRSCSHHFSDDDMLESWSWVRREWVGGARNLSITTTRIWFAILTLFELQIKKKSESWSDRDKRFKH